jgi:hypothetical protein
MYKGKPNGVKRAVDEFCKKNKKVIVGSTQPDWVIIK